MIWKSGYPFLRNYEIIHFSKYRIRGEQKSPVCGAFLYETIFLMHWWHRPSTLWSSRSVLNIDDLDIKDQV